MTSKAIVEMAKEKGIAVNQGKGKNANAKPLSEIYASLELRVKTDRVSKEHSKGGRTSSGKKVDKADYDLDK